MIKIYGKGEKAPFYKEFQGEMNAVFGCSCFVEETETQFIVDPLEDAPIVLSDIVYKPKKQIVFNYDQQINFTT